MPVGVVFATDANCALEKTAYLICVPYGGINLCPHMNWRPPAISLVWLGTIAFLVIEMPLTLAFIFKWYDPENIKFVATVAGGTFALFGFLKKIEEGRFKAADKFIERWNRPDTKPILQRSRPVVEGALHSVDFARPLYVAATATKEQTEIRSDIIQVLGFLEELSIAVTSKSADEERLKKFFGSVVPGGYAGLEGFVLAERTADREHGYYREAQRLVERWTGRKRPEATGF
jgi:hypothetical protein